MNCCGTCAYYGHRGGDAICLRTGKAVGYLWERPCFTTELETQLTPDIMEETTTNPGTKVCKKCGRELPLEAFGKHPKSKDGLQSICRECRGKIMKAINMPEVLLAPPADSHPTTDKELADELRRRGYMVTATKTVEL